jgi:hypothetical protein
MHIHGLLNLHLAQAGSLRQLYAPRDSAPRPHAVDARHRRGVGVVPVRIAVKRASDSSSGHAQPRLACVLIRIQAVDVGRRARR